MLSEKLRFSSTIRLRAAARDEHPEAEYQQCPPLTRLLPRAGGPASRFAMTCAWQIYLIHGVPTKSLILWSKALAIP